MDRTRQQRAMAATFLLVCMAAAASAQTVHKMAVRSDIRFRFASTEVTCVMTNDGDKARELVFGFTLPKEAFISNFSMVIEGKTYPANVKRKGEARKEYLAAKETGSTTGLVEQSTRHSNKFDVAVNIAAGSNVTFNLLYQELLRRKFGAYEYCVHVDPSHVNIKDYSIEVYLQERHEILNVRTPAMRKDIITNAVEEKSNALTVISSPSPTSALVVYQPSPAQLKEMGDGWFVVQYDVNASGNAGDLLVVDGYFVHFFMPPEQLLPLPLDIVFVLDISGSMSGQKMSQMKTAMLEILGDLRDTDRFNLLLFDGSLEQWHQSLQEASDRNVLTAQNYVRGIQSRGSTDIHKALMRGLHLLTGSRESSRVPMMFFLTDGEPTSGMTDPAQINAVVSKRNEGVVNIYSLAFGEGADYKMLRQLSAKNKGFARKIYEASDAAEQVKTLYREISTIVIRDLKVTYHPTSNNDDGSRGVGPIPILPFDNSTITTCVFRDMFDQSDLVVAGRLSEDAAAAFSAPGMRMEVTGLVHPDNVDSPGLTNGKINLVLTEEDLSQLTLGGGDNPFWSRPRDLSKLTERAWAFLTIKQLLEKKTAVQDQKKRVQELDDQIVTLALKYHFVTPLTSLVVTRPEDRKDKEKAAQEASFRDSDDAKKMRRYRPMASHSVRRKQMSMPSMQVNSQHLSQGIRAGPAGASFDYAESMPMPMLPMNPLSPPGGVYTASPIPRASATYPRRVTQAPSVTSRPRRKGRKGKKNRKRGGKSKKTCIKNKRVFLLQTSGRGQETEPWCAELKGARDLTNYTLFADPTSGFSVTLTLHKKYLTSLNVTVPGFKVGLEVNTKGQLQFSPSIVPRDVDLVLIPQSANRSHVTIFYQDYAITVDVLRQKCRSTSLTVDLNLGANDADPAMAAQFTGLAVFADKNQSSQSGNGRKRKQRKRKSKKVKVSRVCLNQQYPDDRSFIYNRGVLSKYKV